MKYHPIIFSTALMPRVLDGTKTQTMGPVKPQPLEEYNDSNLWYPDRYNNEEWWNFWGKRGTKVANKCGLPQFKCPYGIPGDKLWVREAHWMPPRITAKMLREGADTWPKVKYVTEAVHECDIEWLKEMGWKKRPSIHMPRWASRCTLLNKSVDVIRVQDVTEEDIIREGYNEKIAANGFKPHGWMRTMWDLIYGKKYPWDSNPWGWRIQYERVES